jgi:Bacterial regulatory proteins, luxR family
MDDDNMAGTRGPAGPGRFDPGGRPDPAKAVLADIAADAQLKAKTSIDKLRRAQEAAEQMKQPFRTDPATAGPPDAPGLPMPERMFLAEKTVKNYVSSTLAKLGVQRRTQAATFAYADDGA